MARRLPQLANRLLRQFADAERFVDVAERTSTLSRSERVSVGLRIPRNYLYGVYEAAYLRGFIHWEAFLDETFLRYLCGFQNSVSAVTIAPGQTRQRTISAAAVLAYNGSPFALWHDPQKVITRSRRFFAAGPHERILLSYQARLTLFCHVRHKVAHEHADARAKFDAATNSLAGKRYAGSRAGAFLRDFDPSAPTPRRWLSTIFSELHNLALQIAP